MTDLLQPHRPAPPTAPAAGARRRGFFRAKDGRHDLEGLRAIAVLGVVVYHLRPSWLPGGFAGVDVFFVLSGFFITGLLVREVELGGRLDLVRFWGRRARRLLPASALVIAVTVVAGYRMTNALEASRIGRDGLVAAVFGMNWRAAYQGTQYLQDPNPSPLVHYWSLGVEEQFYLAWPLLVLGTGWLAAVLRRRSGGRRAVRRGVLFLCVAVAVPSFLLALEQTLPANPYAYFGTFERAWQLALGGMLAVTAHRLARLPQLVRTLTRYAGVAAVVGFYVAASTGIVYPGRKALVPALGAALIIAAGEPLRRRDPLARLLCSIPAQLGGRYSYGWYLWHYPPLVLLPIYLDRPLRIRELIGCGVATLVLAALTYHLVENPLRSSRWLAARSGGRSLALGALLIAMVAGAAHLTVAASHDAAAHTVISDRYGHPLVPRPAAAAAELPKPYGDGCFAGWHDGLLTKQCRYLPDRGHGDVVLVGDSHAAMWFPAVERMARDQGWGLRFWGRNSCPFADITKRVEGPYTACDRWRADVVRRLVTARPSLVIVAGLDSVLPPFFRRDAAGHPTHQLVDGETGRGLYQEGLARNLAILQAAGVRTLVIHDTPGYPHEFSAPDCVLAHAKDVARCSLPQSQALPGAPNDLGAAAEVNAANAARSRPGLVSTFDATSVFCHGGRCYQVIGSTLAYRDFNHLTAAMVQRLRPALTRAASRAMRRRVDLVVTRA